MSTNGDDYATAGAAPAEGGAAPRRNESAGQTQRNMLVQRELERVQHVISRLQLQEAQASKRAQNAELRAREVEVVRHETEREAKIREQLAIEQRDRSVRQHERVTALRDERRAKAEAARQALRTHKMEMARMTKSQSSFIAQALIDSNAGHINRCTEQHAVIRQSEQNLLSARAATVTRKRELATRAATHQAAELVRNEQQLKLLLDQAEALRRRVEDTRQVERAATSKLQELCGHSPNSSERGQQQQNQSQQQHQPPQPAQRPHHAAGGASSAAQALGSGRGRGDSPPSSPDQGYSDEL